MHVDPKRGGRRVVGQAALLTRDLRQGLAASAEFARHRHGVVASRRGGHPHLADMVDDGRRIAPVLGKGQPGDAGIIHLRPCAHDGAPANPRADLPHR